MLNPLQHRLSRRTLISAGRFELSAVEEGSLGWGAADERDYAPFVRRFASSWKGTPMEILGAVFVSRVAVRQPPDVVLESFERLLCCG